MKLVRQRRMESLVYSCKVGTFKASKQAVLNRSFLYHVYMMYANEWVFLYVIVAKSAKKAIQRGLKS